MANFNPTFDPTATAYRAHAGSDHPQPSLLSRLLFLVFLVVSVFGIAAAYVHMNEKQASLLEAIGSLENTIAISNKELNNLRVAAESHKGNCILLQAQTMGLQPPELGQVIRLHRSEPSVGNPLAPETALAGLDHGASPTRLNP